MDNSHRVSVVSAVPATPPRALDDTDSTASRSSDDIDFDGTARDLLAELPGRWRPDKGTIAREAPRVAGLLRGGWLPGDLVLELIGDGHVPPSVNSPVGLLVTKIRDTNPAPPFTAQPGAMLMSWCGECDGPEPARRRRTIERMGADGMLGEASVRCHKCHPANQLAGARR